MPKNKVMLSFDIEEFDLPRELGQTFSLKQGIKVSSEGTAKILKLLQKNKTKATFFVTGNFIKQNPTLLQKMSAAGHEIACHGVDHFQPAKSDPEKAQKILKSTLGFCADGYRQPRMFKVDPHSLEKANYKYDSSVNPAFIPGRYNNTKIPRQPFWKGKLLEIPASVATPLRLPMFWLALHLYPKRLYLLFAKSTMKSQGFFTTYFHPWEFTDFGGVKGIPWYIRRNSGDKLIQRLDWLIKRLKGGGAQFITYRDFIKNYNRKSKNAQ